jgi:hypothetical protein
MDKFLTTLIGTALAAAVAFTAAPAPAQAAGPVRPTPSASAPANPGGHSGKVTPTANTSKAPAKTPVKKAPTAKAPAKTTAKTPAKSPAKKAKSFKKAARPTISGVARVGRTLTANANFSPKPSYTYQWYRGKKAISGATGSTYKLVQADKGHTVKVKVTGKKSGYTTTSKTSKATGKVKSK